MTIAVMSDLHDNVKAWDIMAEWLRVNAIPALINCGDTVAPAMLKHMTDTFAGDIHTVFGNNADRESETALVRTLPRVKHYGDHGEITLGGKNIFFNHYPEAADRALATGNFDLVCYGHTHLKRWEKRAPSYILNPGTAGGMFQYPSFAKINLDTMSCHFEEVTL